MKGRGIQLSTSSSQLASMVSVDVLGQFIDICLLSRPQIEPVHIDQSSLHSIHSTIYSSSKETLQGMLLSILSAYVLSLYYTGCGSSTAIEESHINTINSLSLQSLQIILTSSPAYHWAHPYTVFTRISFPDALYHAYGLLNRAFVLSKEILLEANNAFEALKSNDKSFKINSKSSSLNSFGPHCICLLTVTSLSHSALLLYIRNEYEILPGLLESLLLHSLIKPLSKPKEGNNKDVAAFRNHNCSVLTQELSAAVISLVLNSKLIRTVFDFVSWFLIVLYVKKVTVDVFNSSQTFKVSFPRQRLRF